MNKEGIMNPEEMSKRILTMKVAINVCNTLGAAHHQALVSDSGEMQAATLTLHAMQQINKGMEELKKMHPLIFRSTMLYMAGHALEEVLNETTELFHDNGVPRNETVKKQIEAVERLTQAREEAHAKSEKARSN